MSSVFVRAPVLPKHCFGFTFGQRHHQRDWRVNQPYAGDDLTTAAGGRLWPCDLPPAPPSAEPAVGRHFTRSRSAGHLATGGARLDKLCTIPRKPYFQRGIASRPATGSTRLPMSTSVAGSEGVDEKSWCEGSLSAASFPHAIPAAAQLSGPEYPVRLLMARCGRPIRHNMPEPERKAGLNVRHRRKW